MCCEYVMNAVYPIDFFIPSPPGIRDIKFYLCLYISMYHIYFLLNNLRKVWRYQRSKLKDRQYNSQMKKDKRTNNDLQNITQKTKDQTTRSQLKTGVPLKQIIWNLFTRSGTIKGRPSTISDFTNFAVLELCPCLLYLAAGASMSYLYIFLFYWCLVIQIKRIVFIHF